MKIRFINSILNKIPLKKLSLGLFCFQLFLVLILCGLIYGLYLNQIHLNISQDKHLNSYLLADELRQSSDDLSRMARAYVATGNSEFEREYWAVLAIRNGEEPRPLDYERIYWDFVSATGEKPRPDGEKIPLRTLMVEEGFTSEELAKLEEAQNNSDSLVKAETIAMNAVKGLYDDGNGNYTVHKEPDLNLARDLMNNKDYFLAKAKIMKPIDDFYVMFENRTQGELNKYLNESEVLFFWILITALFIVLLFILNFIFIRRQITNKEVVENDLAKVNNNLNGIVEEKTKDISERANELEEMNKIMMDRELKFIELKEELEKIKTNKNVLDEQKSVKNTNI